MVHFVLLQLIKIEATAFQSKLIRVLTLILFNQNTMTKVRSRDVRYLQTSVPVPVGVIVILRSVPLIVSLFVSVNVIFTVRPTLNFTI